MTQRTADLNLQFPYNAGASFTLAVTGYDLTQPGVSVALRIHKVRGGDLLASYADTDTEITIVDATTMTVYIDQVDEYAGLAPGMYAYGLDVGIGAIDWRVQGAWEILHSEGVVSPSSVVSSVAIDQVTIQITMVAAAPGVVVASLHSINEHFDVNSTPAADGMRLAWNEDAGVWEPQRSKSALGIVAFPYRFSTSTSSTPTSGNVQIDNTDPSLATMMYIHGTNGDNEDIALWLENIKSGMWLNIYDKGDTERFQAFDATGSSALVGDVYEIPITYYGGGGAAFMHNMQVAMFLRYVEEDAPPGLPAGGDAGNILTKLSSDDYDTAWSGSISAPAFSDVPATDPGVPGQVWSDGGTLKISL